MAQLRETLNKGKFNIHAKALVAIDQHGTAADFGDRPDRRPKGVGGGNHFVARTDTGGLKGNFEGIGSGTDADRMLNPEHAGKHLLELAA